MGDGESASNVMAQLLISLTVAFYFFSQFIFGVIFMFTGFSYTGDNFCTLPVNGTLLDDPDKLLGPEGAIVQWNKMMGIVLITSTMVVTIVCSTISIAEKYLANNDANEPIIAKYVTLFLVGCLSIVQLVLTCLGMNYIFGNKIQEDCMHSHAGDNFAYVTMLIYSWISVLSFSSIGFCILAVIALVSFRPNCFPPGRV
jgi:hypothetical protein